MSESSVKHQASKTEKTDELVLEALLKMAGRSHQRQQLILRRKKRLTAIQRLKGKLHSLNTMSLLYCRRLYVLMTKIIRKISWRVERWRVLNILLPLYNPEEAVSIALIQSFYPQAQVEATQIKFVQDLRLCLHLQIKCIQLQITDISARRVLRREEQRERLQRAGLANLRRLARQQQLLQHVPRALPSLRLAARQQQRQVES